MAPLYFNLNGEADAPELDEDPRSDNLQLAYQYWHLKLNHAQANKMDEAISMGIIPKSLASIKRRPCVQHARVLWQQEPLGGQSENMTTRSWGT